MGNIFVIIEIVSKWVQAETGTFPQVAGPQRQDAVGTLEWYRSSMVMRYVTIGSFLVLNVPRFPLGVRPWDAHIKRRFVSGEMTRRRMYMDRHMVSRSGRLYGV